MSFRVVDQIVKVQQGGEYMETLSPVKVVGHYPDGIDPETGDKKFSQMPPVIRLYLGRDSWGSPSVMPTFEELESGCKKPIVWTIILNPRTGGFNLHHGFGKGYRQDIDPRYSVGDDRREKTKEIEPTQGTLNTFASVLNRIIQDERLANRIVAMMVCEMHDVNDRIRKSKEKKAKKPKQVEPIDPKQAERDAVDRRRRELADRLYLERLAAERVEKATAA